MEVLGFTLILMVAGIVLIGVGGAVSGWPRLASMSIGIGVLFFGAFVLGFEKYPNSQNVMSEQLAVLFAFGSAVSWGISVIGDPAWNSWFNFFAAGFAEFALGYATPLNILG